MRLEGSLVDVGGDLVELGADRGAVLQVRGEVPVLTRLENVSQQGGDGALLVLDLAELSHGVDTALTPLPVPLPHPLQAGPDVVQDVIDDLPLPRVGPDCVSQADGGPLPDGAHLVRQVP